MSQCLKEEVNYFSYIFFLNSVGLGVSDGLRPDKGSKGSIRIAGFRAGSGFWRFRRGGSVVCVGLRSRAAVSFYHVLSTFLLGMPTVVENIGHNMPQKGQTKDMPRQPTWNDLASNAV